MQNGARALGAISLTSGRHPTQCCESLEASASPPPGLLGTVDPPRRSLLSAYAYTKHQAMVRCLCTATYNDMNAVWVSAWAAGAGSDLRSTEPRCNKGALCAPRLDNVLARQLHAPSQWTTALLQFATPSTHAGDVPEHRHPPCARASHG
jgi:hypothetical protein